MKIVFGFVITMLFLSACTQSDFNNAPPKSPGQKKSANGEAAGANSENSKNGGSVGPGDEQLAAGQLRASFTYGPKSTKADFLFVFDNSSSMVEHLNNLKLGFDSLSNAKWPSDTLIAVMTTMPGNPQNLNDVHPAVERYTSIEKEPGFLSLITETARTTFRMANSSMGDRLREPMCAQEWFKPSDKSSSGKSCLSAAIQSPHTSVGVEAGLVAVSQILDKRRQLFRANSNVHIVFVSDTQDPGRDPNDNQNIRALNDIRPTFAVLKNKIMTNSNASGVKLHGVTPSPTCSAAEGVSSRLGTPYQDAIKASGGTWLDFCDGDVARTNYTPVAEQIIANTLSQPVFALPEAASNIVKVVVDGQTLENSRFALLEDKRSVRIDGLSPVSDVQISIIYKK